MSTAYQGSYSNNLYDPRKRYRLNTGGILYPAAGYSKGTPLADSELREIGDASDSFIRQLISANFPRGSSTNNGFQVVQSLTDTNNFTIKGGDGTVDGAGLLFVDGYILFLKSDIEYTAQGTGSLIDDTFTATPPNGLTTALSTRIDTVYVDFYYAEVSATPNSEYYDTSLIVSGLGVPSANRVRQVQDIRVSEGTGSISNITIGTGPQTFTISTGLSFPFIPNVTPIQIMFDNTHYMSGTFTSYSGSAFVVNITSIVGSGSYSSWSILPGDSYDGVGIFHRYIPIAILTRLGSTITTLQIRDLRGLINSIGSFSQGTNITNLILANNSNIGDPTHRIANIYMASTIDYASNLNLNYNGVTKATLTTGGNLGIGSTNPVNNALDINGVGIPFSINSTNSNQNKIVFKDASVIKSYIGGGGATAFAVQNATSTELLTILSNGRVGINSTSPQSVLDVQGDVTIGNNLTVNGTTTTVNTAVTTTEELEVVQNSNASALTITQGPGFGATVMTIANAGTGNALTIDHGNVGIGTTIPSQILDVRRSDNSDGPTITFGSQSQHQGYLGEENTTNVVFLANNYSGATSYLDFRTQGIDLAHTKMRINQVGNVGIGSTQPVYTLDIAGTIRSTSNASFGNTTVNGDGLITGGLSLPNVGYTVQTLGIGTNSISGPNAEAAIDIVTNGNPYAIRIYSGSGYHWMQGANGSGTAYLFSNVEGAVNPWIAYNDGHMQFPQQVAIGSYTAPVGALDVSGNVNITGNVSVLPGYIGIGIAPSNPLTIHSDIVTGLYTALDIIAPYGSSPVSSIMSNTSSKLLTGAEGPAGTTVPGSAAYAGLVVNLKNNPLQLGTNNAINMTILPGGNVGIGSTQPVYILDINGTVGIGTGGTVQIGNLFSGQPGLVATGNFTITPTGELDLEAAGGAVVITSDTAQVNLIAGSSQLAVDPINGNLFTGNVGIGTTNPYAPLSVVGNIYTLGGNIAVLTSNPTLNSTLGIGTSLGGGSGNLDTGFSCGSSVSNFNFVLSNIRIMTIGKNGHVGIGSTNPIAPLDINGDINVTGTISEALSGNSIDLSSTGGSIAMSTSVRVLVTTGPISANPGFNPLFEVDSLINNTAIYAQTTGTGYAVYGLNNDAGGVAVRAHSSGGTAVEAHSTGSGTAIDIVGDVVVSGYTGISTSIVIPGGNTLTFTKGILTGVA